MLFHPPPPRCHHLPFVVVVPPLIVDFSGAIAVLGVIVVLGVVMVSGCCFVLVAGLEM